MGGEQYPVGSLHYCDTSCPSALLVPKENKQKKFIIAQDKGSLCTH